MDSCLKKSFLLDHVIVKHLHTNMRVHLHGVKSLSVRSMASNASLLVMGASSTTVALPSCITLQSAVPFLVRTTYGNVHCIQI